MAKSSKSGADRRAVVEQMRADARRAERRKTAAVLGASVAVAAVILGVVIWQVRQSGAAAGGDLADLGVAASEAGCLDVEETAAQGNNDHRTEGEAIAYDQIPPAAGPHWPQYLIGNQIRPFWTTDDRPPVERLVHSLEHGHTILWYDAALDDAEVEDVEVLARKAAAEVDGKFMAAPWTDDDGDALPDGTSVVLTHWSLGGSDGQAAVRQECAQLSGEAVAQFVADYPPSDSPEPNAP